MTDQTTRIDPGSTTDASIRQIGHLMLDLIELIRDGTENPEVQAQTLAMLFHVAVRSDDPPGVLDLAKLVGVSDASASRSVAHLGRGLRDKPGAGLIDTREDPRNYSRKQVVLSTRGRGLMAQLQGTVIMHMTKMR